MAAIPGSFAKIMRHDDDDIPGAGSPRCFLFLNLSLYISAWVVCFFGSSISVPTDDTVSLDCQ
jgi:hypothetical protein